MPLPGIRFCMLAGWNQYWHECLLLRLDLGSVLKLLALVSKLVVAWATVDVGIGWDGDVLCSVWLTYKQTDHLSTALHQSPSSPIQEGLTNLMESELR